MKTNYCQHSRSSLECLGFFQPCGSHSGGSTGFNVIIIGTRGQQGLFVDHLGDFGFG